jgi:hypothetical protein
MESKKLYNIFRKAEKIFNNTSEAINLILVLKGIRTGYLSGSVNKKKFETFINLYFQNELNYYYHYLVNDNNKSFVVLVYRKDNVINTKLIKDIDKLHKLNKNTDIKIGKFLGYNCPLNLKTRDSNITWYSHSIYSYRLSGSKVLSSTIFNSNEAELFSYISNKPKLEDKEIMLNYIEKINNLFIKEKIPYIAKYIAKQK